MRLQGYLFATPLLVVFYLFFAAAETHPIYFDWSIGGRYAFMILLVLTIGYCISKFPKIKQPDGNK